MCKSSTLQPYVGIIIHYLLLRTSSTMYKQIRITSYAQSRLARPTPLSLSSALLQTLNRVEPRIKIVSGEFQPVLRAQTKQVRDQHVHSTPGKSPTSHHCGVTAARMQCQRAKGATAILVSLLYLVKPLCGKRSSTTPGSDLRHSAGMRTPEMLCEPR